MDQTTFDNLKEQAKINIVNQFINETAFKLIAPMEQAKNKFDLIYSIPKINEETPYLVTSTAKEPLVIKTAEFMCSTLSLSQAVKVLLENRDFAAISLPCNCRIETANQTENAPMTDVSLMLSVQTAEVRQGDQITTLENYPVGVLSFMLSDGHRYFINVSIPQLLASLVSEEN